MKFTLVAIFKKIGHGVKVVAVTVGHAFVALFGAGVAQQFAHDAVGLLKSALGQIVVKVVEEQAALAGKDPNQKREDAVIAIVTLAEQEGIVVAESLVRMLIEIAVQFLKGQLGVTLEQAVAE